MFGGTEMSGKTKSVINKVGVGAMIIGVVAYLVGGGEADGATQLVGQIGTIAGAVIVFVRELLG
jgi:hypothetical protein